MEDRSDLLKKVLTGLLPGQREPVESEAPYIRVVACPGAGKTETITRKIVYLICIGVEPKSIVAFTFTEKAAQSMKDRIYQRVAEYLGSDACTKLGEMYIGTIHSFCLRLLQDKFGFGNYDVLDENQEVAYIMRHGWVLGLGNLDGRYSENCFTFLRSASVIYNELMNRTDIKRNVPDFCEMLEKYEGILEADRLLTFDQMIAMATEHIEKDPSAIDEIEHLIVDEYQDINRAQEKLIILIGETAKVTIVGDPRQCIYQWRGSDESCFRNFEDKFSECISFSIDRNRRSAEKIIVAANLIADSFETMNYERMLPLRDQEGEVHLVECDTVENEANWIANQIENLIQDDQCDYSDIALLLRSVSTSAKPFIEEFKNRVIPYLVGGKVGLFHRDEAQALGRIFAWLGDQFWLESIYGWETIKGDELIYGAMACWGIDNTIKIKTTLKNLLKLKEKIFEKKFRCLTDIYQEVLKILAFDDLDHEDSSDAAMMANLGRFNELLTDFESALRRGRGKVPWENALKSLAWYMATHAQGSYEEQPAEDLRGLDAVQIMTVHQAKGLEWPVVLIPSMTARRFPSSKTGKKRSWMIPRNMFNVNRYEGSTEDERRLFYVALSRAKDLLTVSNFRKIKQRQNPSLFVNRLEKKFKKLKVEEVELNWPTGVEKKPNDEIQTYSTGEIVAYTRCPYMYRLRENWGYQAGLVPELGYGKSLHYILRLLPEEFENIDELSAKDIDNIVDEVSEREFHLPYADTGTRTRLKEEAKKTLKEFIKNSKDELGRIQQVEARLEFPVQNATITGLVDVILGDEGNPNEVRDYKTAYESTFPGEPELQIQLYTLGLKALGHTIQKGSIAYLSDNKIKDVDISEAKLLEIKNYAEECITKISNGEYRSRNNETCKSCDYKKICCYY